MCKVMKFYVHHAPSFALHYKLAHNLSDRKEESHRITGLYRSTPCEFIFDPSFSFIEANDGYHLLDWTAAQKEGSLDPFLPQGVNPSRLTVGWTRAFLLYCLEVVGSRQGWILTLFRGEKLLAQGEVNSNPALYEIEKLIGSLKSHHLVTDTYFLHTRFQETTYPHLHYALTSTLFQWNESWAIRWYVELGEIRRRLNFDWDLIYSVKHHKPLRVQQMLELHRLNLNRVLVQRSDALQNDLYWEADPLLTEIKVNSIREGKDFDHLHWIKNHDGYLDAFFRVLLQGRMLLLDESWSGRENYLSQYLSEKTWGAVLAGIPFLPTHSYPVEILSKLLDLPPHPYLDSVRSYQGDPKALARFIQEFMGNFETGCSLCQSWVNEAQTSLLKLIREKNSLLDLCLQEFTSSGNERSLI
jgi:hypothetical protein